MSGKIALPPCGLFIGSGIYHGQAGYLARSGRTHTAWVPQSDAPEAVLDKVLADNQGNLVQFWGLNGGWGFDGASSPVTLARFHALEELGIEAPLPDWENGKNLSVAQWDIPHHYPERYGAGVLKFVKAAADRGLYSILLYTDAHPEWSRRFHEAGPFYLGYDFGEIFSFRLEEAHLETKEGISLRTLTNDLLRRVRAHVAERKANGWGRVMATSANFYLDYEVAAGAEVPLAEDFAFSHLHMASALSRGLYRQFELPLWGSHLAHEHYSWLPFSSEHKFSLLRAGLYQKLMAGAKILINESGNWFLQTTKAVDSPLFDMPRVELGNIRERDPHRVAPFVPEAQKSFSKIDYHSPYARRYRKEISDFYDYVKAHGTPEGQPEVTVALAKGNGDLCSHEYQPNAAIAGMYTLADGNPNWYPGPPERGWEIARRVFYPRPEVLAPYPNRFLSGTPYGMVDIVSLVEDRLRAPFLSAHYKALLFTGWNTASEAQYRELCAYVRAGGVVFLSIPHLSTDAARNHTAFAVDDLLFGGDFSELCGVRVRGRGRRFYWATAPDRKGQLGFSFPRRFGILTVCMGEIEQVAPDLEVLAVDDEEMEPVLLRHRLGKGAVYFLNTWAYPGALDQDEGPGATLGAPGLVGMVYRHIAREARGTTWISDDGHAPGPECDFISHAYFPEDGSVCLQNIDFARPHTCFFHHPAGAETLTLAPGEFRRFTLPGR